MKRDQIEGLALVFAILIIGAILLYLVEGLHD